MKGWLYRVGGGILAWLLLATLGLWGYGEVYRKRVYPGVVVAGLEVGGMTRAEVTTLLRERLPDPEEEGLVLRAAEAQVRFSWAALGRGFDYTGTAELAYAQGREGKGPARWLQPLRLYFTGREIAPLTTSADPARVETAVARLAEQINAAPVDAQLQIAPDGVHETPGRAGRRLDVEAGVAAVQAALAEGRAGVELPVTALPPRLQEPEPAFSQAQMLLAQSFTVTADDPLTAYTATFQAPPSEVARWLSARPAYHYDPPRMLLEFHQNEIRRWLTEDVASQLGEERLLDVEETLAQILLALNRTTTTAAARIRHPEKRYVVQPGDTLFDIAYNHGFPQWRLEEANPEIEPGTLLVGQELVIPSIDVLFPKPLVPGKRIEISLPEQMLRAYEDDELRFEFRASSGMSTTPTIAGQFQVLMKEPNAYAQRWDLQMPYFMGIYKEGPNFYNGIHALPILASGRRLSAAVLGWPASYGCIILDVDDARALFEWAPIGTLVRIEGVAPGTPSAVETLDEAVSAEP
ncbi:MAG: L,D-transpeptidase family protein [Anaerolineae bacterium]